MPELAELKLTSDFINKSAKDKIFHSVWKNPVHKGKGFEINFPFAVDSLSRGKELMIRISSPNMIETNQSPKFLTLMMTMGMSGHFQLSQITEKPKHTHLSFDSESESLCFVDVRRFGKWQFGEWNPNRGPDPTLDFENFRKNIQENGYGKKEFKKPIHEVLMNQSFFNGIGNYLRAEILYRANCNPFSPAEEALKNYPDIFLLCRDMPMLAYRLGGGRLKDWKNPNGEKAPENWGEFMKCYGIKRMEKITDKNGRTFWFDPKWK